jgi:hypothetical protein
MSELINNREHRKKALKEMIMELHDGKSLEEVKPKFEKMFGGVSSKEISDIEQEIIMEGMPVQEVQRLCNVHASIFKGSIEDIHRDVKEIPGHPVHTFMLENRAIEELIEKDIEPHLKDFKEKDNQEKRYQLLENFNLLLDIDKHYSRKENLLFPYLEKYGITAPPQVMWGVDDEIREKIKEVKSTLQDKNSDHKVIVDKAEDLLYEVNEMIFKEENILFPMAADTLTQDEWITIRDESEEIGYSLTAPTEKWKPERVDLEEQEQQEGKEADKGYVKFETGILNPKEISAIFNHLPVDITFVDKNDIVKYFSQAKERIFPSTKSVIGREVSNCHPPASVHVVEDIVNDFKSGKKDSEEFYIRLGEMYVYIRYFAVRDEKGEYMGTLEVSQNIQPIQEIKGEKRLLTE